MVGGGGGWLTRTFSRLQNVLILLVIINIHHNLTYLIYNLIFMEENIRKVKHVSLFTNELLNHHIKILSNTT